jgi:hypothetical protein
MIEENNSLLASEKQGELMYASDLSMLDKWTRIFFGQSSTAYNIFNGLDGSYPDIYSWISFMIKYYVGSNGMLLVEKLFSMCNKKDNLHIYLGQYNDNLLLIVQEKYEHKCKYIVHSIKFPKNKMIGYIASEYAVYASLPNYIQLVDLSSTPFTWIG